MDPSELPVPATEGEARNASTRDLGWLTPRLRLLIALLGLVLGTSFLGPWWWFGDLLAEFRLQFLIVAGLLTLGAAILRAWPELGLALGIALLDLVGSRPAGPAPARAAADAPGLRLVQFNALKGSAADGPFRDWIAQVEPDLLFVQEVDAARVEALADVPGFRTLAADYREDNFGLVVLVRHELAEQVEVKVRRIQGLPSLEVGLRHGDLELRILSTHTLPPAGRAMAEARNRHLAEAGAWAEAVRARGEVPIIIGDLNATPWAHAFRTLVREHELVDSRRGHGIQSSWPAPLGPVGIPIDHCLHDARLVSVRREVGPHLGSDHRPIVVDLAAAAK